jgi:hypothetical protein
MSKPKQAPAAPGVDLIDEDSDPQTADDLVSAIDEVRGDGGRGTVRVERLTQDRKWEFIDEGDAGAFAVRDVHAAWGGGAYRFTVRNASGQYAHSSRRLLAGPPKSPQAATPAAPASASATPGGDVAALIRDALAEQTRSLAAILAQRPEPASLTSRVEELRALRDLVQPAAATLEPTKALELLKTGIEFGREVSGGDGDPWTILAKAVDAIAPSFKTLIERAAPAPVNGARAAALDRPRVSAANAPAPGSDLAGFLQLLVNRAEQNADPELWADALLDIVPEGELRGFVSLPDPVTELARLDARVALHREWFEEILTLLKGHYAAEHGPASAGDREPGTAS